MRFSTVDFLLYYIMHKKELQLDPTIYNHNDFFLQFTTYKENSNI